MEIADIFAKDRKERITVVIVDEKKEAYFKVLEVVNE